MYVRWNIYHGRAGISGTHHSPYGRPKVVQPDMHLWKLYAECSLLCYTALEVIWTRGQQYETYH